MQYLSVCIFLHLVLSNCLQLILSLFVWPRNVFSLPLSISLPHLVKKIKNHWHIYLHAWTNINFYLSQCDKIWWHLKSLWQNCEALFSWCQSLEPALAKCQWFWANLHCCKWPNFEKIAYPSAHTEGIFLHHQPMSWKQSHSHIFISLSTSL